ncbi:hypothetical protein H0H93_009711 [Arthromyces matolae]|nr:hypothetical protein H0H93_009711 [Arthromyces matolae]
MPTPKLKPSKTSDRGRKGTSSIFGISYQLLLATAVLLVAVLAFIDPHFLTNGPPSRYALCSHEGNKIYTVDADNSQVECIVISGSYVADRGSLGIFSLPHA